MQDTEMRPAGSFSNLVVSPKRVCCDTWPSVLIMNISSAIFDCSAPDLDSCPDESLPEFAFIGRSNVGKSSLLNFLAGRRGLARVSPTPGFTKLINFFTMSKTWRLVDLPGYGFAKVARKDSSKFNHAVLEYLQERPNLHCVFALVDSGLPPQKMDMEFVEWLADNAIPFVLVFTKTDKVKPAQMQANIEAFKESIFEWCETLPEILTCSATAQLGRAALLSVIDEALATEQANGPIEPGGPVEEMEASPEVLPAIGKGMSIQATNKQRPNSTRPW